MNFYREGKGFYIGVYFHSDELTQVRVLFDVCLRHRWVMVGFNLLGFAFDAGWSK